MATDPQATRQGLLKLIATKGERFRCGTGTHVLADNIGEQKRFATGDSQFLTPRLALAITMDGVHPLD